MKKNRRDLVDYAESCSGSYADGMQLGQRGDTCEGRKTGTGGSCKRAGHCDSGKFFERTGNVAFNSVVIIDADGCLPVLL